jgi:matrixin
MKRLDYLVAPVIAVLAAAAGQRVRDFTAHETRFTAVDTTTGSLATGAFDDLRDDERRPRRNPDEVQRRIRMSAAGTYIDEVLLERDSSLARWRDRRTRPLKVWVQRASWVADFDSAFVGIVQRAFTDWTTATDIPLRFAFVSDSSAADVHVSWVDRFDDLISGKTLWSHDDDWWIVEANIQLAVHHHGGERLDRSAVRAIALHEVGHLIGLDHTTDVTNIMTPKVRVKELSEADKATARLLYELPAGNVK